MEPQFCFCHFYNEKATFEYYGNKCLVVISVQKRKHKTVSGYFVNIGNILRLCASFKYFLTCFLYPTIFLFESKYIIHHCCGEILKLQSTCKHQNWFYLASFLSPPPFITKNVLIRLVFRDLVKIP